MTKIYLVHCHNQNDKVMFVSKVFTSRKLANNYAKWKKETKSNKNLFYYITVHRICRLDFGEIPF